MGGSIVHVQVRDMDVLTLQNLTKKVTCTKPANPSAALGRMKQGIEEMVSQPSTTNLLDLPYRISYCDISRQLPSYRGMDERFD